MIFGIELFPCSVENPEDLDEEEMLVRAIALSLEEREVLKEEPCSIKGKKNFKYDLL